MAKDLPIAKLLRECGYHSDAAQAAGHAALLAAGVTREGKGRIVDGMTSRPGRDVQREIDGCDVVVLLGSTEISHTVSATWAGPKTVATQSRGISAFLLEAAEKIDDRAARAGY